MKTTYTKARIALKPTLVEKMGLQSEVFELKKQQFGLRKIAEILGQRHGKHFSYFHVDHFLKRNYEKMQYYLKDDAPAREMAKEQLNEILANMKKLYDEAWSYYNELKESGDMSLKRPVTMNTLLKIIQALGKTVQDVSSRIAPTVQQKFNVLNLTQNIDKSITYLEKKGYILINKKDYDILLKENKRLGGKHGKAKMGSGYKSKEMSKGTSVGSKI